MHCRCEDATAGCSQKWSSNTNVSYLHDMRVYYGFGSVLNDSVALASAPWQAQQLRDAVSVQYVQRSTHRSKSCLA